MNINMIVYVLGWVLQLEAALLLLPMVCALIYKEIWAFHALGVAAIIAFLIGTLATLRKPKRTSYYIREGFVVCALSWMVMSLIGALPFYISKTIPHYIDAVFEIVSGFTTTGASILSDVEHLGKGLLFWRSFSHWVGGMGVLVLVLTILPLGGGYNMMIMKAESPGPDVSKMVPRVADTAKALYKIYFLLTLAWVIIFMLSGMSLFDSLCIAFGSAGTGGFAVRNSGMADYSMFSQFLITIAMLMFGVNFNVYYLCEKRKFKDALGCEEARMYLIFVLSATLFIAFNILKLCGGDLIYSLHHSFFTVSSLITTTGFSTLDFDTWSQPCQMIILFLMFSGACAGSTGGGIKVSRIMILFKEIGKELLVLIHPEAVKHIRMEGKKVDKSVVASVNSYLVMYVLIILVSIFIISFDGFDFVTNFSAVAATFNNIGPGLGAVGPVRNYAEYSDLSKIVLTIDMLAGRLEILPMMILFLPRTWRKGN
ncbi:TrkH family potassium uptake protein [Oribacterium sp. WCC10]|uniref:TrkH family potassium uptake protein n=1 Tax=Oribacterium sp. WCC10 TaxID=1855343 RepID=UPI0008ECD7D7|nr:TrkH family potassium uptake protein [Oribacterium sp. WCC10]SFG08726.1 trk system potassium uptake protein TrkH [Oribacterium sp. WCC10]